MAYAMAVIFYESAYPKLKRLGIPKHTAKGKLDFHGLRVAYINLLFKSGTDLKKAQEMARHSDAKLTLITYGRAADEAKHATVESTYDLVMDGKFVHNPRTK